MDAGAGFDRQCGDLLGSITGANRGVVLVYLPFLIILFGIFGNTLNVIVYSHASFGKSPVNAIFKAQAICDFFLLWNHLYMRSWMLVPSDVGRTTILTLILLSVLLYIRELRLSASWLHVLLAHRRYRAISDPLHSRINTDVDSTRRSIILIVVGCLIESFVLTLLFFLCSFVIPLKFAVTIISIYYQLPFVVTFVILSVTSVRFAWAVIRMKNDRTNIEMSISSNRRHTNRVRSMPANKMILVIVGVFFMTEITPIVALILDVSRQKNIYIDSGCTSTLLFFNIFLYIAPNINTLCYLIMSTQYRRVLKSVFSFKKNSASNSNTDETDAIGRSS